MSRRRWSYYTEWENYPKSRPRAVEGGIKAQSKQGSFGTSWWAKRWIQVLEGFDIGARLGRGRSYARKGQVVAIEVGPGRVTAKVQGSRPKPYDVTIAVKTLAAGEWDTLIEALARQAIFAARLLAGEMPQDIEEALKGTDLSLFPRRRDDLRTDCSCPDPSNPCKHIAAVYYLLGEEFDRDPFLIFGLRGMTRDELLARLAAATGPGPAPAPTDLEVPSTSAPPPRETAPPASPLEPLAAAPAAFWQAGLEPGWLGAVAVPPAAASLPRRLGSFPFWRGTEPFLPALVPLYAAASRRALDTILAPAPDAVPDAESA